MYLGVVACPIPERNFDGRVLLKRVSRKKELKRSAANQRFTDDGQKNAEIREGGWKRCFNREMNIAQLLEIICETYNLTEEVKARLNVKFETYVGEAGNTKWVRADGNKKLSDIR